jgi:hypothetical protein
LVEGNIFIFREINNIYFVKSIHTNTLVLGKISEFQ